MADPYGFMAEVPPKWQAEVRKQGAELAVLYGGWIGCCHSCRDWLPYVRRVVSAMPSQRLDGSEMPSSCKFQAASQKNRNVEIEASTEGKCALIGSHFSQISSFSSLSLVNFGAFCEVSRSNDAVATNGL